MKHAILITTHNNVEITKNLLSLYDDECIDFYILVDKKAKNYQLEILENVCHKSKIKFVERIDIYWGTFSQIQAELILLKEAIKGNYDYYHLISGCDIPLYTKKEFLDFFKQYQGKEFVEYSPEKIAIENNVQSRVKYYYIFMNSIREKSALKRKPQTFIRETFLKIQKIINVDRTHNEKYDYGANWFDITHAFAQYVMQNEAWIQKHFHHSCCADELFLQTLLHKSPYYENNYYHINEKERIIKRNRYTDWERGQPYTFTKEDYDDIIQLKSSFFIRKFDYQYDSQIVDMLFENLRKRDEM